MSKPTPLAKPSAPIEPLLSVKEAAALLSIPEKSLRDMVYRRRIPYLKIDGRVRFSPPDLRDWLAGKKREPV